MLNLIHRIYILNLCLPKYYKIKKNEKKTSIHPARSDPPYKYLKWKFGWLASTYGFSIGRNPKTPPKPPHYYPQSSLPLLQWRNFHLHHRFHSIYHLLNTLLLLCFKSLTLFFNGFTFFTRIRRFLFPTSSSIQTRLISQPMGTLQPQLYFPALP